MIVNALLRALGSRPHDAVALVCPPFICHQCSRSYHTLLSTPPISPTAVYSEAESDTVYGGVFVF